MVNGCETLTHVFQCFTVRLRIRT